MRLSTFLRSLLSLYLQELRNSFVSNDFRAWKEIYSTEGSIWTKSIWNKVLAPSVIMGSVHIFLKLTYSLSLHSLQSRPSQYDVSPLFLSSSHLLSISSRIIFLILPSSAMRTCVTGASLCHTREMASPFLFLQCCFLTVGPVFPSLKRALWEWTSENQQDI